MAALSGIAVAFAFPTRRSKNQASERRRLWGRICPLHYVPFVHHLDSSAKYTGSDLQRERDRPSIDCCMSAVANYCDSDVVKRFSGVLKRGRLTRVRYTHRKDSIEDLFGCNKMDCKRQFCQRYRRKVSPTALKICWPDHFIPSNETGQDDALERQLWRHKVLRRKIGAAYARRRCASEMPKDRRPLCPA